MQATIFYNYAYYRNLSINVIGTFFAQFIKNYIIILQFLIIPGYSPLNHISNEYTHTLIWSMSWNLWLPEKSTSSYLYIFSTGVILLKCELQSTTEENMSGTRFFFIGFIDKNNDNEFITTLIFGIWCSSQKPRQSGNDPFAPLHLGYLSICAFLENFQ